MRGLRDIIKWSLAVVLLVLPESGFSRIHQSPLLEGQGICFQCEKLSLFEGLEETTHELLRPVQHGPRIYREQVPPLRTVRPHSKRRPKASPKPTVFRGSSLRSHVQPTSGSAFMKAIARAARSGAGRSKAGFCYSGVKAILRAAGLKGWLPGGSAVDASRDLRRAGFHDDRSQCNTEGTVRVYRGLATGMSNTAAARYIHSLGYRYTAGDNHGHIEVVGGDGRYYYNSTGKSFTLDSVMGRRRQITGCFVK